MGENDESMDNEERGAMIVETAVEWIEKKLKQNCGAEFTELNKQIFDKAKEIEKLHIQRAFVASKMTLRDEEQYYNQTFLMNKPK